MLEMDVSLNLRNFSMSAQLVIDAPITALLGPPGAGKSTLLQVITGLVNSQHGWIRLAGETLFDSRQGICMPSHQRRIGLVSRDPTAYPYYPVKTHLNEAYAHRTRGTGRIDFDEVIDLLDIERLLDKCSHELSVTERQLAALAHALLSSPKLLLIDDYEKATGKGFTAQYLFFLNRVSERFGLPIIYVPRTLQEALRLTNRIIFIASGKILGAGDINSVINALGVLGATVSSSLDNTLPVIILDHDAEQGCTLANYYGTELVLPVCLDLERGESTFVSIRPGEIALSRTRLDGISIQNQIKGRICAIIKNPEHVTVQVDCGKTLLAVISLRALNVLGLREGDIVYCLAKAQAFSYIREEKSVSLPGMDISNHAMTILH